MTLQKNNKQSINYYINSFFQDYDIPNTRCHYNRENYSNPFCRKGCQKLITTNDCNIQYGICYSFMLQKLNFARYNHVTIAHNECWFISIWLTSATVANKILRFQQYSRYRILSYNFLRLYRKSIKAKNCHNNLVHLE